MTRGYFSIQWVMVTLSFPFAPLCISFLTMTYTDFLTLSRCILEYVPLIVCYKNERETRDESGITSNWGLIQFHSLFSTVCASFPMAVEHGGQT